MSSVLQKPVHPLLLSSSSSTDSRRSQVKDRRKNIMKKEMMNKGHIQEKKKVIWLRLFVLTTVFHFVNRGFKCLLLCINSFGANCKSKSLTWPNSTTLEPRLMRQPSESKPITDRSVKLTASPLRSYTTTRCTCYWSHRILFRAKKYLQKQNNVSKSDWASKLIMQRHMSCSTKRRKIKINGNQTNF